MSKPTSATEQDDTCPECETRLTGGHCWFCGKQWYVQLEPAVEPVQQKAA